MESELKDDEISIEIDEWNLSNQRVYLYDKLTDKDYPLHNEKAIINLEKGKYSGRFFITFSKKKEQILDIDNNFLSDKVSIFYKESTKEINIIHNNNFNISKVELYSILGQKINSWKYKNNNNGDLKLKISSISKSVYLCKITTNKGKISQKIILK